MLAQQGSDVDRDQHHEQDRRSQQYGQLRADHVEEAALEVRSVPQVPIPTAPLVGGLMKCEGMSQRVQFRCCRGVGHSGTKANGNLQAVAELDQGIGWRVRGEAAESGEWDPCCFRDAAEDSREAPRG